MFYNFTVKLKEMTKPKLLDQVRKKLKFNIIIKALG
jgi:hypothetical protein